MTERGGLLARLPVLGHSSGLRPRLVRDGLLILTGVSAVLAANTIVFAFTRWSSAIGDDLSIYLAATQAWLNTGQFYPADQLAGPFPIEVGDVLYPPGAIFLFLPFLVVPAVLWWAVPIAIVAAVAWRLRPVLWAWPLMFLAIAWPQSGALIVTGNPVMWATAALAVGTIHAWPAVLVLVKPSLAPFALFGARHRSWWVALGVVAALNLALLPLWQDFVTVLSNARGDRATLLYSVLDLPLVCIPLIAWVGRSRGVAG